MRILTLTEGKSEVKKDRRGINPASKPSGDVDAKKETARPHQPGQSDFRAILPERIDWKPFAAFPPSARLAMVVGQPRQEGPYTIRVKVPEGLKLMPHRHPEDRVYTVISAL
jgi:hypothetical protein